MPPLDSWRGIESAITDIYWEDEASMAAGSHIKKENNKDGPALYMTCALWWLLSSGQDIAKHKFNSQTGRSDVAYN
jgi:hypothetical protein